MARNRLTRLRWRGPRRLSARGLRVDHHRRRRRHCSSCCLTSWSCGATWWRGRLTLIANEVARLAGVILIEFAAATRKIKDSKSAPEATVDAHQQLQRLMPKRFLVASPWPQLQHFSRYCKAIVLRLDKWRDDPARDALRLSEFRPQEQRYWRLVAERKGVVDERMQEFRWLLEELRVSFFAQTLRTPQPVSLKRLDKAWAQLKH